MTIDTNIIIAYLSGDEKVVKTLHSLRKSGNVIFLPTIVEAETLAFSNITRKERRYIEKFLEENFTSIPFDRLVARIASNIRVETKIKFPDAVIAATAIFTHSPLITRDKKHFKITHKFLTNLNLFPYINTKYQNKY